jgi:hypothetical protein
VKKRRAKPSRPNHSAPSLANAVLAVEDAIAASLPETGGWSPAVQSDRATVGHGARELTAEEDVERLAAQALKPRAKLAPTSPREARYGRVRSAQAAVNTLFAAYQARNEELPDPSAQDAVRDLLTSIEKWVKARAAEQGKAINSVLMTELSAIYQRVVDGVLDRAKQTQEITDLFGRLRLVPADDQLWKKMLTELVTDARYIRSVVSVDTSTGKYASRTVKRTGAVETAAAAISRALDQYGASWPHGRTVLNSQRKMSDRERAMAYWPAPFGASVGPAEVVASVERAVFGTERGVSTLTNSAASKDQASDYARRKAKARAPKKS